LHNVAIIGASGALGSAFVRQIAQRNRLSQIHAFSRTPINSGIPNVTWSPIDLEQESSISAAADSIVTPLDLVIVTTGILHGVDFMPEKSIRELSVEKLQHVFHINTIGPALIAKHFLPKLHTKNRAIFAALSARIGSISDNALGGWYSYRASKAALNMIIKTVSIEMAHRYKLRIIVGLHPGTVDSKLSKPFQEHIPAEKIFTADHSVALMLTLIDRLTPAESGKCFSYDGSEIAP
jgi:NAD(P)-dependent dehydrogenase (short-subunit alcohol dehydrogenase family)